MEKYRGKYRIPSNRWAAWDYGSNGAYFVTICTSDRRPYFGSLSTGALEHTTIGQEAIRCWQEIPTHFQFVILDDFVVMPNHIHGILLINKPEAVEPQNIAALRGNRNQFGPQSQNLASIVRGFKMGVTKFARESNNIFAWQSRYHDHVIRDPEEHNHIRLYIQENPYKWMDDPFYLP